jgi:lysozyme family protein
MPVATVDGLFADLLKNEGGYVNNPNDAGGETNFGITVGVARANGFDGPMRSMTRDDATRIYHRIYWEAPAFDKVFILSPGIAAELFDTGVNCGPAVATTLLQRSLNALNRNGRDYPDITPDGRVGPAVLSDLSAFLNVRGDEGESVMLKALNCLQGERYIRLAEANLKDEDFVFGWLANRVNLPS